MDIELWNSTLDADMNVRYWDSMTTRYTRVDNSLKIFLATMSSGTVAAWRFWSSAPIVWQLLSAISAILAIASPILNYSKTIKTTTDIAWKWQTILNRYEKLRRKDKDLALPESSMEFDKIKDMELSPKRIELNLSISKRKLQQAFDQVKKSRGL